MYFLLYYNITLPQSFSKDGLAKMMPHPLHLTSSSKVQRPSILASHAPDSESWA